ncbi:ABC transporter permease subunit [Paracraurococcus ruber]|nr:ABC transporter permease subunit [Paracraurococcus ruber]
MSGQSLAGAAPLGDAPSRFRLFPRRLGAARRFVAPVVLVLLWQLAAQAGLVSTRLLASPAAIATAAWQLIASGELAYHLAVSLRRVAIGLAIALGFAVPLGLLAGLSRLGEDLVDATLQMLRALPFLALVPLLILWLGIGEATKIALVALGAAFPIYLTLFGGIRGVDPKLLEAGRVFGLSRAGLIRHIVLPGALPQALVGLRYALGTAWLSLVVGEQINATAGIGYLVMDAREFLRTDIILVGLLVYALLGLGADQLVRFIEKAALAWRPSVLGER